MRSAAGGEIEPVDVDHPQLATALWFLTQWKARRLVCRDEPDRDRSILPDDAIGLVFGTGNLERRDFACEIDCGAGRPQVEALRSYFEEVVERRRQHVLPGVLLHVIETPPAVDRAAYGLAHFQPRVRDVIDFAVLVEDIDDPRCAEHTRVERLAAGCRIEGGPIEPHAPSIVIGHSARDRRVEL
jgi:hypothetical protein